jgi:hypothetical protein
MVTKLSATRGSVLCIALALLAGCGGPDRPPPTALSFENLPVSGSLDDALRFGFTNCYRDFAEMRCRRNGVTLLGFGPFSAAVELNGRNGGGGFDQLILWHDRDQNAFFQIGSTLESQGWRVCYTGEGNRGDQAIYMHANAPVKFSMDLSYWGKRRLRIMPASDRRERGC